MEPPSAPPRRGHGPWQGLLLAASLLTLWSPPTTAQLTVESVPSNAIEGKDVLLLVHNLPGGLQGFRWYKGNTAGSGQLIGAFVTATQTTYRGPVYSHRETIYPNGSLLFQNVTLKDMGSYTLETINVDLQSTEASGSFSVYPSLLTLWSPPTTAQLTVESVPCNAIEGKDVLLLVHNLPGGLQGFRWYKGNTADSGQLIGAFVTATQTTYRGPVYSHRETIYPNGSLLFQNVTLKDTGSYTLEVINMDLQSTEASRSFYVYRQHCRDHC